MSVVKRLGVDIGGTFTDVVAVDEDGALHIGKRLTTHGQEHEGVLRAVADVGLELTDPASVVGHGTTLVINALLERRGAKAALVTTEGFADVLDIARGNRSEVFTLRFHREPALIPHDQRFEIAERTLADGTVETAPTEEALADLADRIRAAAPESVVVGFLNSYANPENERRVGEYLRQAIPGLPVTLSSELSRQWREYERFATGAANAAVTPVFHRYLSRLEQGLAEEGLRGRLVVLDSSGGAMDISTATRQPVRAVESGPVGGVIAARALARRHGIDNVVTLDIGGTTAKAAVIEKGDFATTDLYWVGGAKRGFPLQVRTVDIIEVGVGGGSIAWIDEIGRLRIGPRSAGSVPGPVCYGRGGTDVTLTDANLYCGRIDPKWFSGDFPLDVAAAEAAIERLAERANMTPERLALGIIELANNEIAATVRKQTLERGLDPKSFALVASGGGGPLHAASVARIVGISHVLVPRFPGHYSAFGMLEANLRIDRREVLEWHLDSLAVEDLRSLLEKTRAELREELLAGDDPSSAALAFPYSLAVKFAGQEHSLRISIGAEAPDVPDDLVEKLAATFREEYVRRYGHVDALSDLVVVELEVIGERLLPPVVVDADSATTVDEPSTIPALWKESEGRTDTPVMSRASQSVGDSIVGPALLHEPGATLSLPPGVRMTILQDGVARLDVGEGIS